MCVTKKEGLKENWEEREEEKSKGLENLMGSVSEKINSKGS
jgi:hypothetical protein